MYVYRWALVGLILVAVAACAGPNAEAGAVPARAQHAFSLNKTVKFPKSNRAALGWMAGPLTFTEVIVRNPPNAGDLRAAQSDPDDNCHPKLQVGVTHNGKEKMEFHLTVSLEDANGKVYMACERDDSISPGAVNDHTNLCWIDSMKTIDWPKLAAIRIVAEVDPDR